MCGTLFGAIFDVVWYMTTCNFHIGGFDDNASPQSKIFHSLP